MKADLSRGHRPDRARGKNYRRVLLQQSRLVLDSDWAALVDAIDHQLRKVATDAACKSGSPDHGFIVTPGPLLAMFVDESWTTSGAITAVRDYASKYKERFPSLLLDAGGGGGEVEIEARVAVKRSDFSTIRLWARAAPGDTLKLAVEGHAAGSQAGLDADEFRAYDFAVPAAATEYQGLTIGLDSGTARVGMVEGLQTAGSHPTFWITGGSYYVGGLIADGGPDRTYPKAGYPNVGWETADLGNGAKRLLAYLEMHERHITAVHDPGIKEQALGGVLDTTTRTEVVSQVKLLELDPGTTASQVLAAMAAQRDSGEMLEPDLASHVSTTDVCAVPESNGYRGDSNRYYRIEVHDAGNLGPGGAVFKWSRDNGSDLYSVTEIEPGGAAITLASGADVRDGDIIEFLGDGVELGSDDASISAGVFLPPERRSGGLYRVELAEGFGTDGNLKVNILNRMTLAAEAIPQSEIDNASGTNRYWVRRWHGIFETDAPTAPAPGETPTAEVTLEDGIEIELRDGPFSVGSYWQFETRHDTANVGGPWIEVPHGPERRFAPLAILDFTTPADPLELVDWLDDSFSSLCSLTADDIAYDGDGVGSDADTVQQAIDDLYRRDYGGCCHVVYRPGAPGTDDAVQLADLIADELPNGGTVCLRPGTYVFQTPLVTEADIELKGCPSATISVGMSGVQGAIIAKSGTLTLSNLTVTCQPDQANVESLVKVMSPTSALTARGCALIHGGSEPSATAVRSDANVDLGDLTQLAKKVTEAVEAGVFPIPDTGNQPTGPVELNDCIVVAPLGVVIGNTTRVAIIDSFLGCSEAGIAGARIGDMDILSSYVLTSIGTDEITELSKASTSLIRATATAAALMAEKQPGTGTGAVVNGVESGSVNDSAFSGNVGVMIKTGARLEFSSNVYLARMVGLWIDECDRSRFEGEVVPKGALIGINIAHTATAVEITGCNLLARRGIVISADLDKAAADVRTAIGVRLAGSRIIANLVGIQLGRGDGAAMPGVTRNLEIADNVIDRFADDDTHRGVGILVSPPALSGGSSSITVRDNAISSHKVGILAHRSGVAVTGNRIVGGAGPHIGIRLESATAPIVTDNEVDISGAESGSVALSLAFASGAQINSNGLAAARHGLALEAAGSTDLRIEGNRLAFGQCTITGADRLVFVRNQGGGDVRIDGVDGIVADNIITLGGSAPDLRINPARGRWQVNDNSVGGELLLLPPAYGGVFKWPFAWLDAVGTASELKVVEPMTGYFIVHGNPEMVVTNRLANAGEINALSLAEVTLTDYEPLAETLLTPGEIKTVVLETGASAPLPVDIPPDKEAEAVADAAMIEIFANAWEELNLVADVLNIATLFGRRESEVHAQVVSNWANEIQIGHRPSILSASPDADSVVQVIANRADRQLSVNNYQHLVLGQNVAAVSAQLAGWTDQPVRDMNHSTL